MMKQKECITQMEICIKKIILNDFTWRELENYFNINANILRGGLREYFSKDVLHGEQKYYSLLQRIEANEEKAQ